GPAGARLRPASPAPGTCPGWRSGRDILPSPDRPSPFLFSIDPRERGSSPESPPIGTRSRHRRGNRLRASHRPAPAGRGAGPRPRRSSCHGGGRRSAPLQARRPARGADQSAEPAPPARLAAPPRAPPATAAEDRLAAALGRAPTPPRPYAAAVSAEPG